MAFAAQSNLADPAYNNLRIGKSSVSHGGGLGYDIFLLDILCRPITPSWVTRFL
jgi:hypothetical protein